MKFLHIFVIFFLLQNCSKPKTVLICGDHVCINKSEAELYFKENLSLEVKIINNKKNKEINLIELNLKKDLQKNKQISIKQKKQTKKEVKVLTNDEIKKIKKNIKIKEKKDEKEKKLVKKIIKNKKIKKNIPIEKKNKKKITDIVQRKSNVIKGKKDVADVCTIIEKCSINEISKYLLDLGKKKKFPDITIRE